MDAIEKSKPEFGGKEIWCKPEPPVEVRAVRGLLLVFRWQLGEWGFNKKAMKVHVPSSTMTVGGKAVVSVQIVENMMNISWL